MHFQNTDYALKVSIGGHLCQNGELNGQALHQQVEVALERAQASDNNPIWFYTPDMNFKAMARLNMQQGLQRALDRDEFYMQYQPCHTAKGFMSNGMIPILRWRHPTAGVVMSDVFMSLLKDSGLILPVGRWQIRTVLNQLNNWLQSGHWNMRQKLFLSVCEKQLREPNFSEFLQQELYEREIGTEQIVVQISERTAIRNMSALQALSKHIPGLGLCINLTDFGKQYSSLSYLRQLNVDCLCLDQSFFLHMHMDHLETSIAKVVVDVAHRLGIEVLAVGADSQFKVEKMQALGCDALIGEFFTVPLYADSWPDYLKSHS